MKRVLIFGAALFGAWLGAAPAMAQASDFDTTSTLSAPPSAFYPFVRDGYKDNISAVLRESRYNGDDFYCEVRPRNVNLAVVMNSDGRAVRNLSSRSVGWEEYRVKVAWNGKNNAGNFVVKNAYYRIRITATPECWQWSDDVFDWVLVGYGDTETVTTPRFKAATTVVTKRKRTYPWTGYQWSGHAETPYCDARRFSWDNTAWLSCYGFGGYAKAWYFDRIPRKAFNIRARIGGGLIQDSGGRTIKRIERVTRRKVKTTVTVKGDRTYEIRKVWVYYSIKVSI